LKTLTGVLSLIIVCAGLFSCDSEEPVAQQDADAESTDSTLEDTQETTVTDSDDGAEADIELDVDVQQDADVFEVAEDVPPDLPDGLPQTLPFELTRPEQGEPLTPEEIETFSRRITGLWETIDYWRWVLRTSHGMHASTGLPEYLVWWHDVTAVKEGELVTFRNSDAGGGHNVQIPTSRVLAQAAAGYLATGDEAMGRVVEQYARHYVAFCEGLVFDDDDEDHFLMARNIVTQNHQYTIEGDRNVAVDYTGWYSAYDSWNTSRFNFPGNPTYGDIWVTNMRSKDDVPHIYLAAAMLRFVMEYGVDDNVREAATLGYETIQGFARDIVDNGYRIRTRDAEGNVFIPTQDLASFVFYEVVAPDGECNAKLATALIAYGEPLENDCGLGISEDYEHLSTTTHYFNNAIINNFHVAAASHALINHQVDMAQALVEGLGQRIDAFLEPADWVSGADDPRWLRDMAVLLVQAAAVGVPLTSEEARIIVEHYDQTIDPLLEWPRWDLWDDSVPDGSYDHRSGYRPSYTDDEVRIEDIAWLLHYCYSPFQNPAGAQFVDCEMVLDVSAWGE